MCLFILTPLPSALSLGASPIVSFGTILTLSLCADPCCSKHLPWRCYLCPCLYATWARSPPELVSLWILLLEKPKQRDPLSSGTQGNSLELPLCCWRWHCKSVLSLLLRVRPNEAPCSMDTWALAWSYLWDSGLTLNCIFPTGNRVSHHNVCHSVDLHPCQPGSRGYSIFLHRPSEPRTPSWWVFFSPVLLNLLKN